MKQTHTHQKNNSNIFYFYCYLFLFCVPNSFFLDDSEHGPFCITVAFYWRLIIMIMILSRRVFLAVIFGWCATILFLFFQICVWAGYGMCWTQFIRTASNRAKFTDKSRSCIYNISSLYNHILPPHSLYLFLSHIILWFYFSCTFRLFPLLFLLILCIPLFLLLARQSLVICPTFNLLSYF